MCIYKFWVSFDRMGEPCILFLEDIFQSRTDVSKNPFPVEQLLCDAMGYKGGGMLWQCVCAATPFRQADGSFEYSFILPRALNVGVLSGGGCVRKEAKARLGRLKPGLYTGYFYLKSFNRDFIIVHDGCHFRKGKSGPCMVEMGLRGLRFMKDLPGEDDKTYLGSWRRLLEDFSNAFQD